MANLDLNDVAIFVRVIQRGSFAAAARDLRVPTSTVSRTVERLEEAIGVNLVRRTTRAFVPTAEGRAFYEEAAPAVAALGQASRTVGESQTKPHGRLRVTAPPALGGTFVAQVVVEYAARYSEVAVELELSTRAVDLVTEGFDVAVRAGRLADSSLIARKFGRPGQLAVAAPAYRRPKAMPRVPADLAAHEAILFRSISGTATWTFQGPDGESSVNVKGRVMSEDIAVVRAAALAGAGIALLPRLVCAGDIRSGRLVRLLPDHEADGGTNYVVYPSARRIPPKVAAFRDLLFEVCARVEEATEIKPTLRSRSSRS